MKKSGSAGYQPASNCPIPSRLIRLRETRSERIRAREHATPAARRFLRRGPSGAHWRPAGTALLELVGITFIVIVMALLSVNIGVLIFAAWLNDSAARDS